MDVNTTTTSVFDVNLFFTEMEIPRVLTKGQQIGLQVVLNRIHEPQCAERLGAQEVQTATTWKITMTRLRHAVLIRNILIGFPHSPCMSSCIHLTSFGAL